MLLLPLAVQVCPPGKRGLQFAGIEWDYNQTYTGGTFNSTYDQFAYNQSDGVGTGNASWNQSLANSLYLNLSGTNAIGNINISNLTKSWNVTAEGFIARKFFGVALSTTTPIFQALSEGTGSVADVKESKLSIIMDNLIVYLYIQGKTGLEIGNIAGCSDQTIYNRLKKKGIDLHYRKS